MVDYFSKTDDYIKMTNSLSKTDVFTKHYKIC